MKVDQRIQKPVDQFPIGMRVLAVDDDPESLKLLETLLLECQYHVTTTSRASDALQMLREDKEKFDLVMSEVHIHDMDGFKFLELVSLEANLPVIMLSSNGCSKLVMKGIRCGACDYLLKPVSIGELKNIWQHVIRRKKFDSMSQEFSGNQDAANNGGEVGDENNDDLSSQKKQRIVWSVDLHLKFVAAVNQLGIDKAVPKKILHLMNVENLTRENVASHLQKYRIYLRRLSSPENQQASMAVASDIADPSYLCMNSMKTQILTDPNEHMKFQDPTLLQEMHMPFNLDKGASHIGDLSTTIDKSMVFTGLTEPKSLSNGISISNNMWMHGQNHAHDPQSVRDFRNQSLKSDFCSPFDIWSSPGDSQTTSSNSFQSQIKLVEPGFQSNSFQFNGSSMSSVAIQSQISAADSQCQVLEISSSSLFPSLDNKQESSCCPNPNILMPVNGGGAVTMDTMNHYLDVKNTIFQKEVTIKQLVNETKLVSTPFSEKKESFLWILALVVLISSLILPQLFLGPFIVVQLRDVTLAEIVSSIVFEVLFYGGFAIFLLVTDHVQRPYLKFSSKRWRLIPGIRGYSSFSFFATGLKVIIPLFAIFVSWPVLGLPALAAVVPLLSSCAAQLVFEILVDNCGSSCWPLVPIVFEVYRVHQLMRATRFLEALLFKMKDLPSTPQVLDRGSALFFMIFTLQVLGIVCLWSLLTFLLRLFPWSHGAEKLVHEEHDEPLLGEQC